MAAEPVLDARLVLRWCRAALAGLAEAREEIDALNVYPVPDGDTGTNMYLTLEAATDAGERECAAATTAAAGPVLDAIARGALLGARGNSGVILAQMLRAVAAILRRADGRRLEPAAFAEALTGAADAAYASVGTPVEGTILTVARAAARAATECAGPRARLADAALAAARAAREALGRTPDQLEILRRAGVVDAGGRGLTVVFDAFDTVLTGRQPPSYPRMVPVDGELRAHTGDGIAQPSPSYEVMYLLDAAESAIPGLRATLESLGDSLIVVGGDPLWNVHVHVDDAGAAVEAGLTAGRPHRIRITHLAGTTSHLASRAGSRAVIAYAAGEGLAALFESAGVTVVRASVGRPSTAELLAAIRRTATAEVVLLPNSHDGVAVAEAAAVEARADGVRVSVIPTRTQMQGIAAAAVHEPSQSFDADVVAMTTAAGHTRHGAVTVAVKKAVTSAGVCRPGDVLGVVEGDFVVIGTDVQTVAVHVVERMLAAGGELVTIVTGDGADTALAGEVIAAVRRDHPEVDTTVHQGGQPRYPLLIGVE
jgi:DAK2 domain fusion protein YloV